MKLTTITAALVLLPIANALADVPVIDRQNYEIAKQTANTTDP